MATGKIYLIPNTLGGETTADTIPVGVSQIAKDLRHFAVEDVRSARRLLRKMDREFPIDETSFYSLNKYTSTDELQQILGVVRNGNDIGVISEAGCPGVADPGAELVALAQLRGIHVLPMVGPSSILLALMGSGFSGQNFSFHGYLPKERKERIRKLKDFEADSRRNGSTHIFMDTPFRNMHVLDDLLNELSDHTQLCIASNLTLLEQRIKTLSIKEWRDNAYDLAKIPVMFLIGKSQH